MPAAAAAPRGHDLASLGDLHDPSSQVDDRTEDVAVAHKHVATRNANPNGRDDRVRGERCPPGPGRSRRWTLRCRRYRAPHPRSASPRGRRLRSRIGRLCWNSVSTGPSSRTEKDAAPAQSIQRGPRSPRICVGSHTLRPGRRGSCAAPRLCAGAAGCRARRSRSAAAWTLRRWRGPGPARRDPRLARRARR